MSSGPDVSGCRRRIVKGKDAEGRKALAFSDLGIWLRAI